jgi:hypothetical protein
MTDLHTNTSIDMNTVLDEVSVQEFKASFRGELFLSTDEGYEDARKI